MWRNSWQTICPDFVGHKPLHYSPMKIIFILLKYSIWTCIHAFVMYGLRYLDNETNTSTFIIVIPLFIIGIINILSVWNGFRCLKQFNSANVLYCLFCIGNILVYFYFALDFESQSGPL